MTTMQQLVVGIFRDREQAEQAINEFLQAGFSHNQVHFAGRGIARGGILEKIKSLFTGEDISVGGIYDDLVKMGTPPEDASYYQREFEAGRSIVAVQGPGDMQKAVNILIRHGGYGANQRFAPPTGAQAPSTEDEQRLKPRKEKQPFAPPTGAQVPSPEDEQRLKLHEEELRARKQTVQKGEAVLHKDVVAEQKSMDVPVTREEVRVERRPGSGLPSDQPIGEGETYRIPVYEEQVTTEKVPVEREEVILRKQHVQETQQVTETVQREEAHIEHTGDINVRDEDLERGRESGRGRGFKRGGSIEDQTTP